ncbi:MAG: hypothetical protein R6U56_05220, partial [Opitutales bacterium]
MRKLISLLVFICASASVLKASPDKVLAGPCDIPVFFHLTIQRIPNQDLNDTNRFGSFAADLNDEALINNFGVDSYAGAYWKSKSLRLKPGVKYKIDVSSAAANYYTIGTSVPQDFAVLSRDLSTGDELMYTPSIAQNGSGQFEIEIRTLNNFEGQGGLPMGESTPLRVADIAWEVGLGKVGNGYSAGTIRLCSKDLTDQLFERRSLSYFKPFVMADDVDVVFDDPEGNGVFDSLRQISAPQCLIDLVDDTTDGYTMKFYKSGTWNGADYTPVGPVLVSYHIYKTTSGSDETTLNIVKTHGSETFTQTVTYNSTSDSYTLGHSGSSVSKFAMVANTSLPGNKRQEHTITNYSVAPDGLPSGLDESYSFERVYETFSEDAGERLLEASVNSGADKRTDVYEYYRDSNEGHTFSKLKNRVSHFGEWSHILYNDITDRHELTTSGNDTHADTHYYVDDFMLQEEVSVYGPFAAYLADLFWLVSHQGLPILEYRSHNDDFNFDALTESRASLD